MRRAAATTRRSKLADAAGFGYCANHSRYFWRFRLHGPFVLVSTAFAV